MTVFRVRLKSCRAGIDKNTAPAEERAQSVLHVANQVAPVPHWQADAERKKRVPHERDVVYFRTTSGHVLNGS